MRAKAKARATRKHAWDEKWLAVAEERLHYASICSRWVKPGYLPVTDAEKRDERNKVLAQMRDEAADRMYAGNPIFEGTGFFELTRRIKIRIIKPHDWTLKMMRQANANAHRATFAEPLLDQLQPKPPGIDSNSIELWWIGRFEIVASEKGGPLY